MTRYIYYVRPSAKRVNQIARTNFRATRAARVESVPAKRADFL